MRISTLIKKLSSFKKEHGDILVSVDEQSFNTCCEHGCESYVHKIKNLKLTKFSNYEYVEDTSKARAFKSVAIFGTVPEHKNE